MGRPRDQRTPGGGVLLQKGLIFDPGFQSGTVLIPFQILLALDIKPAGFFMPRLNVIGFQSDRRPTSSREDSKNLQIHLIFSTISCSLPFLQQQEAFRRVHHP